MDATVVLDIWREFVTNASVSLDFQNNDAEFARVPGKYSLPEGRIILAEHSDQIVGCVALRKVNREICEMKRLYVRPFARGLGLRLAERIVQEAKQAGYSEMRLDVLAESKKAREIYRALGFQPAEPVSYNPLPGTSFLGLKL